MPSQFLKAKDSVCEHEQCKSNMMLHILEKFGIDTHNTIAVGDGDNDICMVKLAGKGVSFNSTSMQMDLVADHIVKDRSLKPVLDIAM